MFPGFDFQTDLPTPSPRKRRREAYSKLLRLFLQNTKDRLDEIRDVIKDESESHFNLNRPQSDKIQSTDDSMSKSDPFRFSEENNDEQKRKFIDFAFADATSTSHDSEDTNGVNNDDAAKTYIKSLFAAVGYSRMTTTPAPTTQQENIFSRYVLNPLFNAWNTTRERFYLVNGNNSEMEDITSAADQSAIFRVNFYDNHGNSKETIQNNFKNSFKNKSITDIGRDKSIESLPLIQITSKNVTNVLITNETIVETIENKVNVSQTTLDAVDTNGDHVGGDKKPRNTVAGTVDDAAAAFRGAFLRYSKHHRNGTANASRDHEHDENSRNLKNHSNEEKSSKFIDGTLFAGNLFDGNSSHIQVVPGKKNKTNELMNEITTIANDFDETTDVTAKSFGENAGILILEIFGTIIGMTWRAVSDIPNYFGSNQNTNV